VGARSSGGNRCLVGATGAIARGAFGCWFSWQKEQQSVAAAFAGKVQGFTDVINWRGIREFILRGYKSQSTMILFSCSRLMLARLDYCRRTSLAKSLDFTTTRAGSKWALPYQSLGSPELFPGLTSRAEPYLDARAAHIEAKSVV
jgi:hypothetical protein